MICNNILHILIVGDFFEDSDIIKSVASIANAMSDRGHKVTIYSKRSIIRLFKYLYRSIYYIKYKKQFKNEKSEQPKSKKGIRYLCPLNKNIKVYHYKFSDNNLKVQRMRKRISILSPDVCVCFFSDRLQLLWAVTLLGSGVPYVYSEYSSQNIIENLSWNRKERLSAMSGADIIHFLSSSFVDSVPSFLKDKIRVIPNFLTLQSNYVSKKKDLITKKVVLLSHFTLENENLFVVLDAFALLEKKYPDWELYIIINNNKIKKTISYSIDLGLESRVHIFHKIECLDNLYQVADIFCYLENHINCSDVLLTALSFSLPVIGLSTCEGFSDIVCNDNNGIIVDKMESHFFAAQLDRLMSDGKLRERLGLKAKESILKYSEKIIFDAWESLFFEASSKKRQTVMDGFNDEPFASLARMASRSRQEYASRDFGKPFPGSFFYKILSLSKNIKRFIDVKLSR